MKAVHEAEAYASQVALPGLLSGEAAFDALKYAVHELSCSVPEDHDVVVQAFDLIVHEIRFIRPYILLFEGRDHEDHAAFVMCHFSQIVARIVYRPKSGTSRIITGFSDAPLV